MFQLEQERRMKTGWGGGSQNRFLTRSLAIDVIFSLLGGGRKPTGVGERGGTHTPRVCACTGVRADRAPRQGELTRVRGCDRAWRCHGRDRAWPGYQQRVCVDGNVVCARLCVCVRVSERERERANRCVFRLRVPLSGC